MIADAMLILGCSYRSLKQARHVAHSAFDLLLQLGRRIAADYSVRAGVPVVVTVDALASLNGRRAAALVDPGVDLAGLEDGFGRASWILPLPDEAPPHLTAVATR